MKSADDQAGNSCGNTSEHLTKPMGTVGGCVGTTHPTGPGEESALAALQRQRPEWQRDALCREYPDVPWFPGKGQTAEPALQVCGRCLVRVECLGWALADPSLDHGVLGGLSAKARARARHLEQRRTDHAET